MGNYYWFYDWFFVNMIRMSKMGWYKRMLTIMRKQVIGQMNPLGDYPGTWGPVRQWIGKELYLAHSKLSSIDKAYKDHKKARDQDRPGWWTFKRYIVRLPIELSVPICWYLLNKNGRVAIEDRRDDHWVDYLIIKKVEGGYNFTINHGELCIPRHIKRWGKDWYRWIKDVSYHYEIRDGKLTKALKVYRENRKARKWLFKTETKLGINHAPTSKLGKSIMAKVLGIDLSEVSLQEGLSKQMYPWVTPGAHTLAGRSGNNWRYAQSPAEILIRYGIKPAKSLVKMMHKNAVCFTHEAGSMLPEPMMERVHELDLNIAAIIWYLTRDINHTRTAMEPVPNNNYMITPLQLDGNKRIFKLIFDRFGNSVKKMMNFLNSGYPGDSVKMLKALIKNGGDIEAVDWRSPSSLHDSLSAQYNLLHNERLWKQRSVPFKYDEVIKELHGLEVVPGMRLLLPEDGNELLQWGKHLHNCAASYMDHIRDKRCTLIGVSTGGERSHLLETNITIIKDEGKAIVKRMEIRQFKADFNSRPELEPWLYVVESITEQGWKLNFSGWDMPHEVKQARQRETQYKMHEAIHDAIDGPERRQIVNDGEVIGEMAVRPARARIQDPFDHRLNNFIARAEENVRGLDIEEEDQGPADVDRDPFLAQFPAAQPAPLYIYNPLHPVRLDWPANPHNPNEIVPVHNLNGDMVGWQHIDVALPDDRGRNRMDVMNNNNEDDVPF